MQLKLVKGTGSPTTGACWMSALSYYAGYEWSDHPECVDPVIRQLCITLNDALPDETREAVIGPHMMAPIGTNRGSAIAQQRQLACVDRLLRVWLPRRLDRLGGLTGDPSLDRLPVVRRSEARYGEIASRLRALPPIACIEDAEATLTMTSDLHANEAVKALVHGPDFTLSYADHFLSPAHFSVAHSIAYATTDDILALILDLCAMGERTEIPQVRDLCALPQACR